VGLLCESLALPLEQAVACLSTLELALHQTQRLSGGEDGLASCTRRHVGGRTSINVVQVVKELEQALEATDLCSVPAA
jgi:hypothetical protein